MSESLKKLIDAHILNLQLEKKADQQEIKDLKSRIKKLTKKGRDGYKEENEQLKAQLAQILKYIWNDIAEIHNDPELEFDCDSCVIHSLCDGNDLCKIYESDDFFDKINEVLKDE